MRFAFWMVFCGSVSWTIAAKTLSLGTQYADAKAWVYGAVLGLGFAIGTARWKRFSIRKGILIGFGWILACTTLYVWFFRAVSNSEVQEVVLIGLLLSIPGAVVLMVPIRGGRGGLDNGVGSNSE